MSEVLEVLFGYLQDHRIPRYLESEEYRRNVRIADRQFQRLQQELTPQQRKHLTAYQNEREKAVYREHEATFQAGLALGLSLGAWANEAPN